MKTNKLILAFLMMTTLFFSNFVYADLSHSDKFFLKKCNQEGIKVINKQLILNFNKKINNDSWVYLLQNISDQPVYINHPAEHPGTASAGWMSRLDEKQWSALMLTRKNFMITCQSNLANAIKEQPACKKLIKIYRFKPQTLSTDKQGNYWIVENKSLNRVIKNMNIRGIYNYYK